jgi:glutathione S-transferase
MSLFRKKETPAEEFLHVYTQVRQLCTWTKGDIPSAFRVGIQQSRAQQALIEWARENNPTIDYLSDIRRKVVSRKANKSEIKHAIARAQSILDDLDQRLAELGRRI